MTTKATHVEWPLGYDCFGRQVTLKRTENQGWIIHIDALNQRDDDQRVWYLTRDMLVAAGEIAAKERE